MLAIALVHKGVALAIALVHKGVALAIALCIKAWRLPSPCA